MQTKTNNVNKTWSFLPTTGGKDEPNVVFYADITTRNTERKDTTQNTIQMNNTDPNNNRKYDINS